MPASGFKYLLHASGSTIYLFWFSHEFLMHVHNSLLKKYGTYLFPCYSDIKCPTEFLIIHILNNSLPNSPPHSQHTNYPVVHAPKLWMIFLFSTSIYTQVITSPQITSSLFLQQHHFNAKLNYYSSQLLQYFALLPPSHPITPGAAKVICQDISQIRLLLIMIPHNP